MKNWRTTLIGCVLAGITAIQPLIQHGDIELKRDWMNLVATALIGVFSWVAKDAGVTGTEK